MSTNFPAILSEFPSLRAAGRDLVLATIFETQGSTYQKAGARMLITDEGYYYGLLGGGCFEPDLIERTREVFETGVPRIVDYDMRGADDALWGLGLGCEGAVRIFLQRLTARDDYYPLPAIQTRLDGMRRDMLVTVIQSDAAEIPPGTIFLAEGDAPAGVPADFIEESVATALALRDSPDSRPVQHLFGDHNVTVFYSPVTPPTHLLIIGAGPDALPVLRVALSIGWRVSIADHRDAMARPERFPGAHRVIATPPGDLHDAVALDQVDAAILMTHRFETDSQFLAQLAGCDVRYLGLLGPIARRQRLIETLPSEAARRIAPRAYGPAGLDLGGRLPEQIALSVVAQAQAVLSARGAGHLHDPVEDVRAVSEHLDSLFVIVLAAGGSTRFGALKQLLEFGGESLLRRAVRTANAVTGDRVIVVHGPKPTKCQREIADLPATNVVNEEWQSGMSSSIRRGIRSLPPECGAALIVLCDQPFIGAGQLELIAHGWASSPEKIAAAGYAETFGVPAVFPRGLFADLLKLHGDQGAKTILEAHADDIIRIPLPEAEMDIDTQEDFEAALKRS